MVEQLQQAEITQSALLGHGQNDSSSGFLAFDKSSFNTLFSDSESKARLAKGLDTGDTQVKSSELGLISYDISFDGKSYLRYDADARPDGLSEFSRAAIAGGTETRSTFEGRADGLLSEKKVLRPEVKEQELSFDSLKRNDGLQQSHRIKTTDGMIDLQFNNYNARLREDGLAHESISRDNGVTKTTRSFENNPTGLVSETAEKSKEGTKTTSYFGDGNRTETVRNSEGKITETKTFDSSGNLIQPDGKQEKTADQLTNNSEQTFEPKAVEDAHLEQFKEYLESQNFQLAPIKKGWGPYQALHQAAKELGINFSTQQLLNESMRIRDRELADPARTGFQLGEVLPYLSSKEIDQAVELERNRYRNSAGV